MLKKTFIFTIECTWYIAVYW